MLGQPDVEHVQGLRDRAIPELLYSTGLCRANATRLSVYDIEPLRGIVRVRQGKGRNDRVVPIGEWVLAWVQRYPEEARPAFAADAQERALFLNRFGRPFQGNGLGTMARRYIEAAGIPKRGACHLFRHAMATQMLEHGADVSYIQAMLGHENLDTTQVHPRLDRQAAGGACGHAPDGAVGAAVSRRREAALECRPSPTGAPPCPRYSNRKRTN